MMYAHLPRLLASRLTAEAAGGREERGCRDRMEVEVEGAMPGGGGRESKTARELYPLLMIVLV